MKIKDADILIIPGLGDSSPFHWQSRWQQNMSTARRVEQDDWDNPNREVWTAKVIEAVAEAEKPAILVAHSVGVLTVVHAAPDLDHSKVAGAFLVGASDWERDSLEERFPGHGFAPVPREPLGFRGLMLASSNDETCKVEKAEHWARDWDVQFGNAGEAGHFTEESGHGPWPEGLMAFAKFTQSL
ncbi:RBBP9/YdeN family alpha/beta hydrolase [Maricaulis sp. MIT060901]|uniref:RBBP9/YdeN family alpha/beta hydrolase n=1 Tax=Maricaulis sp. MIT060901 TaxID=3096993 RepID=UPI00399B01B1